MRSRPVSLSSVATSYVVILSLLGCHYKPRDISSHSIDNIDYFFPLCSEMLLHQSVELRISARDELLTQDELHLVKSIIFW